MPMMEMRAMERGDEVLKARAAEAMGAARRKSMEDMVVIVGGFGVTWVLWRDWLSWGTMREMDAICGW